MWVYTYSTYVNNTNYLENSQFGWEFYSKSYKILNLTTSRFICLLVLFLV